jgi:hypothetical protein
VCPFEPARDEVAPVALDDGRDYFDDGGDH